MHSNNNITAWPFTVNINNNYSVDILSDPNTAGDITSGGEAYLDSQSMKYYAFKIVPSENSSNPAPNGTPSIKPLIAANFKVDGVIGEYQWDMNYNPNPFGHEYPPATPHNIPSQQAIKHTYRNTLSGTQILHNQTSAVQGPIRFDNIQYLQSNAWLNNTTDAFTWSRIHIVEVYENNGNSGTYDAGTLHNHARTISNAEFTWPIYVGDMNDIQSFGIDHPNGNMTVKRIAKFLRVFVVLKNNPNVSLGSQTSTSQLSGLQQDYLDKLVIDFDEVVPVHGCMDNTRGNYNQNATIDDGSCDPPPPPPLTITVTPSIANAWVNTVGGGQYPIPYGPYNAGETYNNINGTSFTVNSVFGFGGSLGGQNIDNTRGVDFPIAINGTFEEGDHVQETVTIEIYPRTAIVNGNVVDIIQDYPVPGGAVANINPVTSYNQNMGGWGSASDNLTGASLRIKQPFLDGSGNSYGWMNPTYIPGGYTNPLTNWHIGNDPSDPTEINSQPTKKCNFVDQHGNTNFKHNVWGDFTSSIQVIENSHPASDPFPYRLKLEISLDFIYPALQMGQTNIDIPVELIHATHHQGDPNWVDPDPLCGPSAIYGCTDNGTAINGAGVVNDADGDGDPAFNYDPLATCDDGSCYPIIIGCTDPNALNYDPPSVPPNPQVDVNTDGNLYDGATDYNGDGLPGPFTGCCYNSLVCPQYKSIVCSMMNEFYGTSPVMNNIWLKHAMSMPYSNVYQTGYHAIFLPLVRFVKKNPKGTLNNMVRVVLEHIAIHRTLDVKYEMEKTNRHLLGRTYRFFTEPLCFIVGAVKLIFKK